jgi:hypothetical protein
MCSNSLLYNRHRHGHAGYVAAYTLLLSIVVYLLLVLVTKPSLHTERYVQIHCKLLLFYSSAATPCMYSFVKGMENPNQQSTEQDRYIV